jgi:hypothetical protein
VYYVDKDVTDAKMKNRANTRVKPSQIKLIINNNADVYDKDNNLLIRFRKNRLSKKNINLFYKNVIKHASKSTSNRGSTSGSKKKNVADNPQIMTNIFGYFDKFSPQQKALQNKRNMKLKLNARECKFNMDNPEEYKKTIPLIKEIDAQYKKLVPKKYAAQRKKANQTHFKIPGTSFTTITTNINFQTTIHTDKGDDPDGFGNLAVIERGEYTGGETCLPQYGVGVDIRQGDVIFMNVHEWHGNLPIKRKNKDVIRLSIVCYLRHNLWEKTKNVSKKDMIEHNNKIRNMRSSNKIKK